MPKITNVSARQITIPITEKVMILDKQTGLEQENIIVKRRIIFKPLLVVNVSMEDWRYLKSLYLIQCLIDNGDLLQGTAAARESTTQDIIDNELRKDLDRSEMEKQSA